MGDREGLSEEVLTELRPAGGERWPCRIGAACPQGQEAGVEPEDGTGWQSDYLEMMVTATSFLLFLNDSSLFGIFYL